MKKIIAATIMALSLFATASVAKEIKNTELKYSIIQVADGDKSIIGEGTIYLANPKNNGEFAQADVSSSRNVAYTASCSVSKTKIKEEKDPVIKKDCDMQFADEGYSLSAKVKKSEDNLFLSYFDVSISKILGFNEAVFPADSDQTQEELAWDNRKVVMPDLKSINSRFNAINKPGNKYSYVIGNETLKKELLLNKKKFKEQKVQYILEITIS
jgi:hypothetical protein